MQGQGAGGRREPDETARRAMIQMIPFDKQLILRGN